MFFLQMVFLIFVLIFYTMDIAKKLKSSKPFEKLLLNKCKTAANKGRTFILPSYNQSFFAV